MRLIDADALIEELNETQVEGDELYKGLGKAKVLVCYQPTINIVSIEELLNMLNGRLDFLKKWRDATTDFKKIAKAKIEDCEEIIDIIKTYGFTDSLKDKEKTDETVCSKK